VDALKAGLAIWRRTWKRSLVIGLLATLPWLLFVALIIAIIVDSGAPLADNGDLGMLVWAMWLAPFGDQVLALSVYRADQAHRAGVAPRAWYRPRSIGWNVLTALLVTLLLGAAVIIPPVVALLTPFVYVSALAAGAERRALPGAMVRGFRISKGFRWQVLWTALLLWAVRWGIGIAATQFFDDDAFAQGAGFIAMTLLNLSLTGLFAAVMVAFYLRMSERHDDVTGALGRVFE
jgi:hypothetical protein